MSSPGAPRSLLWDVTASCNLRCKHCYNARYWREQHATQDITQKDAIHLIDAAHQFGVRHLHFLGGEPLMRPDLPNLIRHAKRRGLVVTINTNGLLLDENMIHDLLTSRVDQISISLDGATQNENDAIRGVGTFNSVLDGTRRLTEACRHMTEPPVVLFSLVLTRLNIGSAPSLPRLASSVGVNRINLLTLYECGEAEHNVLKLRLAEEDVIQAISDVVRNASQEPDMHVQVDCKPRVLRYISRECGVSVGIASSSSRCPAGEELWAIEADGSVHPCGPCRSSLGAQVQLNGGLRREKINLATENGFDKVLGSDYWKRLMFPTHATKFR